MRQCVRHFVTSDCIVGELARLEVSEDFEMELSPGD